MQEGHETTALLPPPPPPEASPLAPIPKEPVLPEGDIQGPPIPSELSPYPFPPSGDIHGAPSPQEFRPQPSPEDIERTIMLLREGKNSEGKELTPEELMEEITKLGTFASEGLPPELGDRLKEVVMAAQMGHVPPDQVLDIIARLNPVEFSPEDKQIFQEAMRGAKEDITVEDQAVKNEKMKGLTDTIRGLYKKYPKLTFLLGGFMALIFAAFFKGMKSLTVGGGQQQ